MDLHFAVLYHMSIDFASFRTTILLGLILLKRNASGRGRANFRHPPGKKSCLSCMLFAVSHLRGQCPRQ